MTLSDAGAQLERAIRGAFAGFAGAVEVDEVASRPWVSLTFAGARHRLGVRIAGQTAGVAASAFLAGLEEREFALHGHILADIALVEEVRDGGGARLTLEALTVESG